MPEADSLLLEMEIETAKVINTDGLKALFQWAKRITDFLIFNLKLCNFSSHFRVSDALARLKIFLFAAELMPEADSLLLEMEIETAKVINTDGLKALFQWAKRITNRSDIQGNRIAKPHLLSANFSL